MIKIEFPSFGWAVRPAGYGAGYLLLTGLVYLGYALGSLAGFTHGGLCGLVLDIGLVGAALWVYGRRAPDLAAALGPFLALLLIVAFFALAEALAHHFWPDRFRYISFWTMANLQNISVQWSQIAMGALGMTLIMIAGGIDLSVGTAITLCATLLADCLMGPEKGVLLGSLAYLAGAESPLARFLELPAVRLGCGISACLAGGVLTGLLNGTLVSALRIVPFIVTLGTMTIFVGLGNLIGDNSPVRPPMELFPKWLPAMVMPNVHYERMWLAYPLLPNFAWGVWLVVAMAAVLGGLLHGTVFGRHVFALGSNEATARLCGVRVSLTKVAVYAVAGAFVGLAGLYSFSYLSTGSPEAGRGMELRIIAAVVIGGGSLSGGRGSLGGTLTGAAITYTIENGCQMLGLQPPIINIIIGTIIIAAVWVDQYRQRRLTGE